MSVFFLNVAVIFMNVKTNLFGLTLLMADVYCKRHSVYNNNVQNDTERLFRSPQCSTRECGLSCVKVKLSNLILIICSSNVQLPLLLFLHYRG